MRMCIVWGMIRLIKLMVFVMEIISVVINVVILINSICVW